MAEYHVGCGAFAIYAGTLNSRNKNLWQNKSEVTDEATAAVAQYLLEHDESMFFEYKGEKHKLCVMEVDDGHTDKDVERLLSISASNVVPMRLGRWIVSHIPGEKYVCSECGGACWYYDYEGVVAKKPALPQLRGEDG